MRLRKLNINAVTAVASRDSSTSTTTQIRKYRLRMEIFDKARARWKYLRKLTPLFSDCLPTVLNSGDAQPQDGTLENLNNEITKLRSEIKLNILRQDQHEEDLEQLIDIASAEQLAESGKQLLNMYESLIDDEILHDGGVKLEGGEMILSEVVDSTSLVSLSKIQVLLELLGGCETKSNISSLSACFVRFPEQEGAIASCRQIAQQYGTTIMNVFAEKFGHHCIEARTQHFKEKDVEILQNAFTFASTAINYKYQSVHVGNLGGFQLLLQSMRRSPTTVAHGFPRNSLITRRSVEKPIDTRFLLAEACVSAKLSGYIPHMHISCITFSDIEIWERAIAHNPEFENPTTDPSGLGALLGHNAYVGVPHSRHFYRKHRELLSYLLAFTLFQLYGSPWIHTNFSQDTVFLYPTSGHLYQWKPHIHCALAPTEGSSSISDYMAAFGVLVMELEANEQAEWTDDDIDWETGTKSNQVRLARILKEWKEKVPDDCRLVSQACHDFEVLVEELDHPKISSHLKCLAIVYKCILEPLLQLLEKNFGFDTQLFKNIPGPWGYQTTFADEIKSRVTMRELFDDFDIVEADKKVEYAKQFMSGLEPFLIRIKNLRKAPLNLSTGPSQCKEKIRIAVLDSGVDDSDGTVKFAIRTKRIVERRSWVGNQSDCQDTYGHGTHVTRLLLQTAPEAAIYVAKICNGKIINDEYLTCIAKAIDWAVDTWNADIISLSFGFDNDHDLIDAAIDRAILKGKLIFAAASNGGGRKARTRPATNSGVVCIHACDGLGNRGDMSPNPQPNTYNFTTLGVGVPSRLRKGLETKEVWKSGTSFATPIAAGFAANIMEFANLCCTLSDHRRALLRKARGMVAIFNRMSTERDGYQFVYPPRLWDEKNNEELGKEIEKILRSL
ncbi:M-protease [Arthrobotrys entomopaga]|nr:M-protease [Arthrobotrys entomopaga]